MKFLKKLLMLAMIFNASFVNAAMVICEKEIPNETASTINLYKTGKVIMTNEVAGEIVGAHESGFAFRCILEEIWNSYKNVSWWQRFLAIFKPIKLNEKTEAVKKKYLIDLSAFYIPFAGLYVTVTKKTKKTNWWQSFKEFWKNRKEKKLVEIWQFNKTKKRIEPYSGNCKNELLALRPITENCNQLTVNDDSPEHEKIRAELGIKKKADILACDNLKKFEEKLMKKGVEPAAKVIEELIKVAGQLIKVIKDPTQTLECESILTKLIELFALPIKSTIPVNGFFPLAIDNDNLTEPAVGNCKWNSPDFDKRSAMALLELIDKKEYKDPMLIDYNKWQEELAKNPYNPEDPKSKLNELMNLYRTQFLSLYLTGYILKNNLLDAKTADGKPDETFSSKPTELKAMDELAKNCRIISDKEHFTLTKANDLVTKVKQDMQKFKI